MPTQLISTRQIENRIAEVAAEINHAFIRSNMLSFIVVLNDGFMFAADLMRRIDLPNTATYVQLTTRTETVNFNRPPSLITPFVSTVFGADVIILDGLFDDPKRYQPLQDVLQRGIPKSISVVSLLTKINPAMTVIKPLISAFEIPNISAYGYGLEADQQFRNLSYIATQD